MSGMSSVLVSVDANSACCAASASDPDSGLGFVQDEEINSGVGALDPSSSSSPALKDEKSKYSTNSSAEALVVAVVVPLGSPKAPRARLGSELSGAEL
jgi:hypothetical protein